MKWNGVIWKSISRYKKEPKERIHHYSIKTLTKVYFGANTPVIAKKRIYKFNRQKHHELQFFKSIFSNQGNIKYNEMDQDEEWDNYCLLN